MGALRAVTCIGDHDGLIAVTSRDLMRCKQFNAELSTIGALFLSLFSPCLEQPYGGIPQVPDVIGALEVDRPRRALYGPSVPSWFQTRPVDGLILSGNAPKVKQYFIILYFCRWFSVYGATLSLRRQTSYRAIAFRYLIYNNKREPFIKIYNLYSLHGRLIVHNPLCSRDFDANTIIN